MRGMQQPLISVIITNWNYAKYVEQAIRSVLNQTYKNIEIIIIDDGSTDDSDAVIQRVVKEYPEITYIKQKNRGVVDARNRGMTVARGDFLCCLDADDWFSDDYIEKNYRYIMEYNADIVYPNWRLFGDINETVHFQEFDFTEYQKQHLHIKPESLIRSSAIKQKNGKLRYGYLPETKDRANDWAYFISLAANGLKFKLANDNYINYRIKQGSMGSKNSRSKDVGIFYNYLCMFKERYGNKIIEPIELPLAIIEQQTSEIDAIRQTLSSQEGLIHSQDDNIEGLKQESARLQEELHKLYTSSSWKVTEPLRICHRMIKKSKSILNYYLAGIKSCYTRRVDNIVIHDTETKLKSVVREHEYAVVLHLFYEDMWHNKFRDSLKQLYAVAPFDLYISISASGGVEEEIKKDFPLAYIVKLPNRGRDVMPFTVVFNALKNKHYRGVLKLHSKKSTHTNGGSSWMDHVMSGLIPRGKKELEAILQALDQNKTLVGLESVYIPLTTYLSENRESLNTLTGGYIDNGQRVHDLGFFAGTMFWISGDYPYIDEINVGRFEDEAGQTDGTYAHAIERFISIKPQIEHKKIFGIDNNHVVFEITKKDIKVVNEINDWEEFINEK